MRLKITRRLSGSIDGLQLSHFEPGEVYEVGTSLGSYLLALGAAEPALDEAPATLVPVSPDRPEKLGRSPFHDDLSQAADSSSRPSTFAQGAPSKVEGRNR